MYTLAMRSPPRSTPSPDSAGYSSRPTNGRQTLGSSHGAVQRATTPGHETPDLQWFGTGEPVWWNVFKDRCKALGDGEAGRTAGRIVHHVESGWAFIREIQLACERQRGQGGASGNRLSHFLAYLEGDVVTGFVRCTEAATRIRPAELSGVAGDEPSVCTLAAGFDRAVAVAALAAQARDVSPDFHASIMAVAAGLVDWGSEMCTLASALDRIFVTPAEPPSHHTG